MEILVKGILIMDGVFIMVIVLKIYILPMKLVVDVVVGKIDRKSL